MTAYRCRFTAPLSSDWRTIEADSPEWAANELHSQDTRTYSIGFTPDPNKRGNIVYFSSVEVEGHGSWVSRMYTSGIVRRGGVKTNRGVSLEDVAKAVGWNGPASELLDPGWDAQESEWT